MPPVEVLSAPGGGVSPGVSPPRRSLSGGGGVYGSESVYYVNLCGWAGARHPGGAPGRSLARVSGGVCAPARGRVSISPRRFLAFLGALWALWAAYSRVHAPGAWQRPPERIRGA